MTPAEMLELSRLMKKLGAETEVDPDEVKAYLPDISDSDAMRDFYLPRVGPNFYFNSRVLRGLVTPNLRRL